MRFLLLHIILLIGTLQLHAQINLVPNPSFEDADICSGFCAFPFDTIYNEAENESRAPHHWVAVCQIPISFSYNGTDPNISTGGLYWQKPRTGGAMVGLVSYVDDPQVGGWASGHKDNIGVKLTRPMLPGAYYKVVFYVNMGNHYIDIPHNGYNISATTALGAHFSVNKLNYVSKAYKSLAPIVPQIINPANRYLYDTVGWDKIEGLYKAEGGEEWLTLGDFGNRINDSVVFKDSSKPLYPTTTYFIDDVSVTHFDPPLFVTDTTICRGRSFLYHKRPDWDSCIWYDGSSDSSKVFTQSGVYWVTHFYAGFTATDTIKLTITDSLPVQTYYLGYCVGDSVLLKARPAQQYIWNNSSTQQTQVVKQAATYYVTGNTLGCLTTDTFHVKEFVLPIISGLKDTVVCFDDIKKIELDAGLHNTYLWQPTGETTRTIYSTMAMLYNLTVTDTNGCKSSQQVAVNEQCNLQLYVPNAFSPNNDGVNEIFKISINPNNIKQFEVYNRWGQLIAQNQTGTWDGKDAPQGVYVIILYYTNDNGQEQRYSGNVTLMR